MTAQNAPFPVNATASDELKLSIAQRDQCRTVVVAIDETDDRATRSCQIPVTIGLFFDGTSNNRDRDEADRAHSNIARLFNTHPSADAKDSELKRVGYYSIYVAGIGTRFDANKEFLEDKDGKAKGKGGQARILYGVIQVFNAIHRAFSDQAALYTETEIHALLKDFESQVETAYTHSARDSYERPAPTRDGWLKEFNQKIAVKIDQTRQSGKPLPYIPSVTVNVFGFSRGAAEAAAFCHWLNAALIQGKIAHIPVHIGFAGLFDCVASVGLADSARRALGTQFLDGHFAWAAEILRPLPALVSKVVHFIAAHEQRLNFPLTRIRAIGEVQEVIYPGMHSDVGGGYGLLSQGRSPSDGELLSQIPLMHMHREARAAGVPLVMPDEMAEKALKDYSLSADLSAGWNSYMQALDADYQSKQPETTSEAASGISACRNLDALVRHHMRLFYAVRRMSLGRMQMWIDDHKLTLNEQDKEDVVSYDARLAADVKLCENLHQVQQLHPNYLEVRVVQDFIRANPKLSFNNVFAHVEVIGEKALAADRQWMNQVAYPVLSGQEPVQAQGAVALVARYVHDSLAGFYLVGYTTREDKSMKLVEALNKAEKCEPLNPHEQSLVDNYNKVSQEKKELRDLVGDYRKERNAISKANLFERDRELALEAFDMKRTFTPDQNKTITDSELGIFPKVLTDADADLLLNDGLEKDAVHVISNGRREGGGYLLPRATFPLPK